MTFEFKFRVVRFKDFPLRIGRLYAELTAVQFLDQDQRKVRQIAYFNGLTPFLDRLLKARLGDTKTYEIRAAAEAAFREPGTTIRVLSTTLSPSQLYAMGYRILAQQNEPARCQATHVPALGEEETTKQQAPRRAGHA